jgi:hypothetical protein
MSQYGPSVEDAIKYIRGFFDRLCYVDTSSRSIVLTTNQTDLARRVGSMIRTLGIKCSIQKMGKVVKLRVSGRKPLELWAKEIGFEPEKMIKLDRVLASYRRPNVEPTGTTERATAVEAEGVSGESRSQD